MLPMHMCYCAQAIEHVSLCDSVMWVVSIRSSGSISAAVNNCEVVDLLCVRMRPAALWCECCAVLCCAVLCCAVLCCAVLCCAVLCCAVLCCAAHNLLSCTPLRVKSFVLCSKIRLRMQSIRDNNKIHTSKLSTVMHVSMALHANNQNQHL